MTVYVASLFLPYTVHFEVESSKVPRLNESDIVEPVEGPPAKVSSGLSGPEDSEFDESTGSILQSLANKSTTNLASQPDSDVVSVSSVESESNQAAAAGGHQPIPPPSHLQHRSFSGSPSSRVSVRDFFFNNPNSSRYSVNSMSRLDEPSGGLAGGSTGESDALPRSRSFVVSRSASPGASTYVRPRSRLRNTLAPASSVSELGAKHGIPLGRSLYAAAARRGTSANKLPELRQRSPLAETVTSAPPAQTPLRGDLADRELDRYFADKTDQTKLVPFGGFSRDYHSLLEDDPANVFATAPWKVVRFSRGNGSLRNAITDAAEVAGDVRWIGTPAMPSDLLPKETKDAIRVRLSDEFDSDVIYVDDTVFAGHYDRLCKQVLWPILHYQLPEQQQANAELNDSWHDYEAVNRQFADTIVARYKPGDTIWVHDYHLMLVPQMVREALPKAKIGFFLHVSFPSSEIFRCLAQRKQILRGILGADSVGLQNDEFVRHFFQCCNRLLLADFDDHGVRYDGRTISVTSNPVGINAASLHRLLEGDGVRSWRELVRERWPDKTLVVSRDKLDKIRGVKEKLLAYERFLNDNPEHLESTLLLLICIPTRGQPDERMENEILSIVERINSRTKNIASDMPVVVLNQDLQFEQYLALLAEAGLFIVSTLREGMNLTCHEFVEASAEDHAPLILSEFVGSAALLQEGALVTNPYNVAEVARAIKQCSEMAAGEKAQRWQAMHAAVLQHDSLHWVKKGLEDIEAAHEICTSQQPADAKKLNGTLLEREIHSAGPTTGPARRSSRLFMIDIAGLLNNLTVQGTKVDPVQQRLMDGILNNLASDPANAVYLLSSSSRSDLEMHCRSLIDVGMLSENGSFVRLCNESQFRPLVNKSRLDWMSAVLETMKTFCLRIPGTYVETLSSMIRYHTEGSHDIEPESRDKLVGELMSHINELYGHDWNVHANIVNQMVVVQEEGTMSRALEYVRSSHRTVEGGLSFAFVSGGTSPADEEAYEYFNGLDRSQIRVITVKVGQSRESSGAEFKLQGVNELLIALSQLT